MQASLQSCDSTRGHQDLFALPILQVVGYARSGGINEFFEHYGGGGSFREQAFKLDPAVEQMSTHFEMEVPYPHHTRCTHAHGCCQTL